MEYEVVVYEQETRKVVSSLEWRMCKKEEADIKEEPDKKKSKKEEGRDLNHD